MGFGVWGLGFGVWGLGFGVWGFGFGVWGVACRVYDFRAAGFFERCFLFVPFLRVRGVWGFQGF